MRELMGKIQTKDPHITQNIYLSETVRCQECKKTVPVGIEVIMIKKVGEAKKVVKHEYYCRAHAYDSHGVDYESKMRSWR
jgi:hypothetical protein